jgi:Tfp pilus assembly protein PilF
MTPHPVPAAAAAATVLAALVLSGCVSAARDFKSACPDEATCRDGLESSAAAYRAAGAAEEALDFFERVIATYPDLAAEARAHRAYFLERCGEAGPALGEYQAAAKDAPSARTLALLGDLRARIGDPHGALAAYRAAQDLAPADPAIVSSVARMEWTLGATQEARQTLLRALAMEPVPSQALTLLAQLELAEGREPEALAALTRAAAADPTNLESRYELSRRAWRAGNTGEARRWLDELRALEATLDRYPAN